jgi:hypothetical protein
MRRTALLCCALFLVTTAACRRPGTGTGRTTTTRPGVGTTVPGPPLGAADCDRACLKGFTDQYLAALFAHDPSRLPLAPNVRFTEDNVVKRVGDGLWKTATRAGGYRQELLDVPAGVAGLHAVLDEGAKQVLFLLRLRIVDHEITEIETVVVRTAAEGSGILRTDNLKAPSPAMNVVPPAGQLNTRDEDIRLAEYYPAGLRVGSFAKVDAPFTADAYRLENGQKMAGPGCVMAALGCNIKTQTFPSMAGLTYRVTGVDEEMGIVWLAMNFYQSGANSFIVWEMFKVYGGEIHAVEAVMKNMPTAPVW